MPRYFFDTRDDGEIICDDEGVNLPDVKAAIKLASRTLAEIALDVIPSCNERCLGVDVRDEQQREVLTTELVYKAVLFSAAA